MFRQICIVGMGIYEFEVQWIEFLREFWIRDLELRILVEKEMRQMMDNRFIDLNECFVNCIYSVQNCVWYLVVFNKYLLSKYGKI